MKNSFWGMTLLLVSVPFGASAQYYLTDSLTSIDPSRWVTGGALSASAAGLSGPDSNGGSLISKALIPDGTSDAEVRTTIALTKPGGNYTHFLRATADARSSGQSGGTFLALEMQNPTFDAAGHCVANFVLLQSTGGAISALSSFPHACRNGMEVRFAIHGNIALVWPDQAAPMEFALAGVPVIGQPGVGTHGTPAGNAVSRVQLGLVNHTAPPAVDSQSIAVAAYRRRVDIQWKGITGSVPVAYWVYRDGDYQMRTDVPRFSDESVTAGSKHTYTIYAVDQHYNMSAGTSLTVATPVPLPGSRSAPIPPTTGRR